MYLTPLMIIVSYSLSKLYLLSSSKNVSSSDVSSFSPLNHSSIPPGYSTTFEKPAFIICFAKFFDALHPGFAQ